MNNWDATLTHFATALPGFEEREEQTNLAHANEAALNDNERLLAQAGCGTGKSFGGLVPLINFALATGRKGVVSTATIALQTQYAQKDLPFLQGLYEAAGTPFSFALVKGRSNYVCLAKLAADDLDVTGLPSLREELEGDHTGDLNDIVTDLDPREHSKITASSDECPGKAECEFGERCFAEFAKTRAANADVVVVNHSMLIVDTEVRMRSIENKGLIPEPGALLIDEAHELEDYATNALGSEFTERGLESFGRDVAEGFLKEPSAQRALSDATSVLFAALESFLGRNKARSSRPETAKRMSVVDLADLAENLLGVWEAVNGLRAATAEIQIYGDDKKKIVKKRLMVRAERLLARINSVMTSDADQLVRWVERDAKRGLLLKYAPLEVGPFLAQNVWRTEDSASLGPASPRPSILMSATLSAGDNDFTYIARALGLADYASFDAGSPFDFEKQAAIYVPKARTSANPKGFADPSKDSALWRTQCHQTIGSLVESAGGRTLVTFTSRTAMEDAYDALADRISDMGLLLMKQGERPLRAISEEFTRNETSVVFALKSLMTGADFQGDCLRVMVLDKVPFVSPSDIIFSARCEAADKRVAARYGVTGSRATFHREGSFYGISVPAATLVAAQAVGRLIRTKDDEGLMVILDPRISEYGGKAYARKIRAALPPARKLENLREARAYLAELSARRDTVAVA
jgi:ATP-dependent DNA helicase DinG